MPALALHTNGILSSLLGFINLVPTKHSLMLEDAI
jgi:hypothetical protein